MFIVSLLKPGHKLGHPSMFQCLHFFVTLSLIFVLSRKIRFKPNGSQTKGTSMPKICVKIIQHVMSFLRHIIVTSHGSHGVSSHRQLLCLFKPIPLKIAKVLIYSLLWGESTSYRWIVLPKGSWCGKHFHIMMSSYWCHKCVLSSLIISCPSCVM